MNLFHLTSNIKQFCPYWSWKPVSCIQSSHIIHYGLPFDLFGRSCNAPSLTWKPSRQRSSAQILDLDHRSNKQSFRTKTKWFEDFPRRPRTHPLQIRFPLAHHSPYGAGHSSQRSQVLGRRQVTGARGCFEEGGPLYGQICCQTQV